ncbi:MAG: hypothetical protein PQJ60_05225 [Spirochaetales bacterium]|nr:hypothetical protein [Spirochaetales bacterium]
MKKRVPLIVFLSLFFLGSLFSQSRWDIWWSSGVNFGLYAYTRENIVETSTDEAEPNGTLSLGLKTHCFVFKSGRNIGLWANLDFRIPFKSLVEGELATIDAQEGSIQVLSNLGLGLGFRFPLGSKIILYGGAGAHLYFSYLHAYTLYSSPLLAEESQTEIEQYDLSLGWGGEAGVRLNWGRKFYLMAGTDFSRDYDSYQDTFVYIDQDPPINYISVGPVPDFNAWQLSPYLTFGFSY